MSATRPTEPGYYFWKAYGAAKWEVVRVHRARAGHHVIHWLQREGFTFLEQEDGIWGQRIPTPDETEKPKDPWLVNISRRRWILNGGGI